MQSKNKIPNKKLKKKSWKKFISKFNKETPTPNIWKNIRKLKGQHPANQIPAIIQHNKIISDSSQIAEIFAETFSNYSGNHELSIEVLNIKSTQEINLTNFSNNNTESYNTPFTLEELRLATNGIKTNSPGPDNSG